MSTSTTTWKGRQEFETTFPAGERMTLASVPAAERPGPGTSPMEAIAAALAACSGIDVVLILEKMRKELVSLRIETETVRRDEQPRIYTSITLVYHVDGPGLDGKSVARAVRLSEDKYCSVAGMLRPTVELSHRIMLNGEPLEE